MFAEAFSIVLRPIMFSLSWFTNILTSAGALPAFIAMFAASVVARVIIRPLVGHKAGETRRKNSSESGGSD